MFRALLDEVPDEGATTLRLGNVLFLQRRLPEAAATLETAWRLGTDEARVPRKISEIWTELGDHRQATVWAERAAKQAAEPDPQLTLHLADLHYKLQDYDRTRHFATQLVDVEDKSLRAPAHLLLGQIAAKNNDTDTAIKHWQIAVDAGFDGADLLGHLAGYYYNRQDYRQAAVYLQRVVDAEDADDEQRLRFLIVSYVQCRDSSGAEAYLLKYLERHGLTDEPQALIRDWASATSSSGSTPQQAEPRAKGARPAPRR